MIDALGLDEFVDPLDDEVLSHLGERELCGRNSGSILGGCRECVVFVMKKMLGECAACPSKTRAIRIDMDVGLASRTRTL